MTRPISRPYLKVAIALYQSLNTPRSLSCLILARHQEWDQLVAKTVDPLDYLDSLSGINNLSRDIQAVDFLRKSVDVPSSFDRKKAALDSFRRSEEQCKRTNDFIDYLDLSPDCVYAQRCSRIISGARKIIKRILGRIPDELFGSFGPGTVFELKGQPFSTVADKLWVTPHVTPDALAVWEHTSSSLHWVRRRQELGLPYCSFAPGNRFTTVPKDGKTDRGICIEPLCNVYCQLGVGRYLKERLGRVGIHVARSQRPSDPLLDLLHRPRPNGQLIHRAIAERASVYGSWATIDLSNASDTVAYRLVETLFPDDWFLLLSSLRSPKTQLPNGEWVDLNKFSSMGNGFTFELETLVFLALLASETGLKAGVDLFVYGDDIIVPTDKGKDALAVLQAFGFTPNRSKTFLSGLFRESCGGDYFAGWFVRGYQSTSEPRSPVEWIAMHNQLRWRFPYGTHHLGRVIQEQVPAQYRLFGPSRAGDTVFHSKHQAAWSVKHSDGIKWLKCLGGKTAKLDLLRWGDEFTVSLALLGVSSVGISPRGWIPLPRISRYSIS